MDWIQGTLIAWVWRRKGAVTVVSANRSAKEREMLDRLSRLVPVDGYAESQPRSLRTNLRQDSVSDSKAGSTKREARRLSRPLKGRGADEKPLQAGDGPTHKRKSVGRLGAADAGNDSSDADEKASMVSGVSNAIRGSVTRMLQRSVSLRSQPGAGGGAADADADAGAGVAGAEQSGVEVMLDNELPRELIKEVERRVDASLVIGRDRYLDNDLTQGFRQMTDMAVRALSAAINDPFSAIQVVDKLSVLFYELARRERSNVVIRDTANM